MTTTTVRPDQTPGEVQRCAVGTDPNHPQAKILTQSTLRSPAGHSSDSGHQAYDAHTALAAVGADSPTVQQSDGTQSVDGGGGSDRNGSATTTERSPSAKAASSLADPLLALAADILDDAETTRKANASRLARLTRHDYVGDDSLCVRCGKPLKKPGNHNTDKDGVIRGLGMDESHPDPVIRNAVKHLAAQVEMLEELEHKAELNLNRLLRAHPLGPWVKAQKGIGDKQAARLLAVIGDPYLNMQTGQPRTVSQLWAYCGHGDPTRRKFKGMTQADLFTLGNPVAKSRTWLIACSILKAQGPFSTVYYDRKEATEGRLHQTACVRCGPSGKPALDGSPWSDAHRHADALRITGKAILKGLWLEAKRLHDTPAPP